MMGILMVLSYNVQGNSAACNAGALAMAMVGNIMMQHGCIFGGKAVQPTQKANLLAQHIWGLERGARGPWLSYKALVQTRLES